tara:strand:+ start:253 stop:438 length:186 start_codon:yes stop_codon:yes gene_type:complete
MTPESFKKNLGDIHREMLSLGDKIQFLSRPGWMIRKIYPSGQVVNYHLIKISNNTNKFSLK